MSQMSLGSSSLRADRPRAPLAVRLLLGDEHRRALRVPVVLADVVAARERARALEAVQVVVVPRGRARAAGCCRRRSSRSSQAKPSCTAVCTLRSSSSCTASSAPASAGRRGQIASAAIPAVVIAPVMIPRRPAPPGSRSPGPCPLSDGVVALARLAAARDDAADAWGRPSPARRACRSSAFRKQDDGMRGTAVARGPQPEQRVLRVREVAGRTHTGSATSRRRAGLRRGTSPAPAPTPRCPWEPARLLRLRLRVAARVLLGLHLRVGTSR